MNISEKARLRWACRRGMLELDLILIPFFDQKFDDLSLQEREIFADLLRSPDPDLFRWLLGYPLPERLPFADLVKKIRVWNLGSLTV